MTRFSSTVELVLARCVTNLVVPREGLFELEKDVILDETRFRFKLMFGWNQQIAFRVCVS